MGFLRKTAESQNLHKKKGKDNGRIPKRKTIVSKISLTVAAIIAVVMTVTSVIIYSFIYNGMVSRNKESMEVIASGVYENFNSMVAIQTNQISDLALDSSIIDLVSQKAGKGTNADNHVKEINEKLKNNFDDPKTTEHVFITDSRGIVTADSHEEYLNYDYSRNQCVSSAKAGMLNMSTVHISPESGKAVVTMVAPIKNRQGQVIGTLGKDLYTDYFSQRFDSFRFLSSGYIYIVDSDNMVIYHPDKLKINKKNSIRQIAEIIGNKDSLAKKNSGSINYEQNGRNYLAYYTSVPALKSLVVLSVDANELKKEANMAGQISIISAVVMILIVTALMYLVINRILKPLGLLIRNTEEMAQGNLKVSADISENNEFGQLSSSFNLMAENIKDVIANTKKVITELTHLSNTIKSGQESTESGMKDIAASSELIKSDNIRINEAVEHSSDSFKKIVTKTREMKTQSIMMIDKTNDIRKANYNGLETIKKLKNANFSSVEKISRVNTSFHELFENLEDIKDIANLVTNISKQTHILSLNASIEAARAGEAGKGFNVVANHIKSLSLNISEQMGKIEELVRKINSNIISTRDDLDEVNKSAGDEVSAVQETMDNYNLILRVTDDIISAINNINESINILNNENSNVNEVISNMSVLSGEFSESLEEINSIIGNQYENTRVMAQLVEELNHSTEDINKNMSKFTV